MIFSDPRWAEALAKLPDYLGSHIRVSIAALALGLIISLPLALLARNRPALRGTLLAIASVVQTVPGLALPIRLATGRMESCQSRPQKDYLR